MAATDHLLEATPTIEWSVSAADCVASFDSPWDGWIIAKADAPAGLLLVSVGVTSLNLAKSAFLNGYQVSAGTTVALKITGGAARDGDPVSDDCQFLPAAAAIGIAGVTFDNTAPGAVSIAGTTFDNGSPGAVSIAGVTFDNGAPEEVSVGGVTFDNTPAAGRVLDGETSPVEGVATPASPIAVEHTFTLVAGTNYLVQAVSRGAAVQVDLPDPGALGQRIEISDASIQADTYPITINAGTKVIGTGVATTYVLNRPGAVLAIYYTGSRWQIF